VRVSWYWFRSPAGKASKATLQIPTEKRGQAGAGKASAAGGRAAQAGSTTLVPAAAPRRFPVTPKP
jgi:hypothetical protein